MIIYYHETKDEENNHIAYEKHNSGYCYRIVNGKRKRISYSRFVSEVWDV